MKKLISTIAVFIFASLTNTAFAQCPGGWVRQGGCAYSFDRALATVVDNTGNVYVAGQYSDTAFFSSATLISSSYEDIFLAKYDPNGNLIWIKSAGGYNIDSPSSLAVDTSNSVYMTGVNFGTAVFDTITLNNFSGYPNAFVAKYDSAGNVQWAKSIGSSDWDQGEGIAVRNNNIYITGSFSLSVTIGSTTLTSLGQRDFYLVKMDLDGNFIWARSGGSNQIDLGRRLAVDNLGNIFVTGAFFEDMTISTATLINQGYYDVFLAKYDSSGNFLWATSAGSWGDDYCSGLALDSSSNVYISLAITSGCVFGAITINTYGDKDIALAKYDSGGTVLWVKNAGGTSGDGGGGVAVGTSNKIYQTGRFSGNATFGMITLNLPWSDYIFLAEYDSSGDVNYVKHAGGYYSDEGIDVACSANNVFVCGEFSGTTSFDSNTLSADTMGGNAFIWKACSGPVGMDESVETSEITIYPNPFTNVLQIDSRNNQPVEIILWDIASRIIIREYFITTISLSTTELSNGMYVYEIRGKDGVIDRGKVVKE